MVKITETEFTDMDGRVRKTRKIEASYVRVERADGSTEEYSNCIADEWPYSPDGSPPEWKVFGILISPVALFKLGINSINLLGENRETILKLVGIKMLELMSQEGGSGLIGTEAPLEDTDSDEQTSLPMH